MEEAWNGASAAGIPSVLRVIDALSIHTLEEIFSVKVLVIKSPG